MLKRNVNQAARAEAVDVEAARALLEAAAAELGAALGPLRGQRSPRGFLRGLLDAVRGLHLHRQAPVSPFLASLNDTAMLEFLQGASEEPLDYQPGQWLQPLDQLLRYSSPVAR